MFGSKLTKACVLISLFGAGGVRATTSAFNTSSVAPTLAVSATVQTAVSLTLATGTSGTPCALSPGGGGDFNISFGNVNGLGVGTPTCGSVTSTGSNATYATSYQLTASYAGFSSISGTTVVLTTPGFTHSGLLTLGEAATTAGPFTAIPSSGSAVSVSTPTSAVAINQALALTVSNTNGGSAFTGNDSAIVTFTLTVQ